MNIISPNFNLDFGQSTIAIRTEGDTVKQLTLHVLLKNHSGTKRVEGGRWKDRSGFCLPRAVVASNRRLPRLYDVLH